MLLERLTVDSDDISGFSNAIETLVIADINALILSVSIAMHCDALEGVYKLIRRFFRAFRAFLFASDDGEWCESWQYTRHFPQYPPSAMLALPSAHDDDSTPAKT